MGGWGTRRTKNKKQPKSKKKVLGKFVETVGGQDGKFERNGLQGNGRSEKAEERDRYSSRGRTSVNGKKLSVSRETRNGLGAARPTRGRSKTHITVGAGEMAKYIMHEARKRPWTLKKNRDYQKRNREKIKGKKGKGKCWLSTRA